MAAIGNGFFAPDAIDVWLFFMAVNITAAVIAKTSPIPVSGKASLTVSYERLKISGKGWE
jgi:hypothetical protein